MKSFYVFLDVDGVLNHYKWIKFVYRLGLEKKGYSRTVCPFNVKVLNKLLKSIEQNGWEPVVVISSSCRFQNMEKIVALLKQNHIHYSGEFHACDECIIRGKSIQNFMAQHAVTNNYVVIDDEISDILPYLPKEHIIRTTGIFASGLTNKNIKKFVSRLQELNAEEQTL